MSQQETSDETQPQLQLHQNPPVAPTNEVVVDDSGALSTYSNFCRVTATPEEVILDCGLNSPAVRGGSARPSRQTSGLS